MELLKEHLPDGNIIKNKFLDETLVQDNTNEVSIINIDEIGTYEFMCFEQQGFVFFLQQ